MADVQEKINKLWDGASKEYDSRPSHGVHNAEHEAAWRDALAAMLPPAPADVLDVGTGTGVIALLLAGMGYAVTGIDLSEGMLGEARRKAQASGTTARFEIGDAMDPPGAPASVDAIISRHVLWTLTDPGRGLTNWLRILRPGGRLVTVDGLWGRLPAGRIDDIAPALPLMSPTVTVGDITRLVATNGFTNITTRDLTEIDRLEHALSDEPTAEPHYAISATKPG